MVRSMLDDHISRKMGSSSSGDHDESADEQLIKDIAAMAYGAGADTTVSSIVSFFLAMLVYPDVQIKAQAEIDRVVGQERLPEMNDMNSLPYINAVVTECLRWLTVLPMGKSSCLGVVFANDLHAP
jgi:cytochrome P450